MLESKLSRIDSTLSTNPLKNSIITVRMSVAITVTAATNTGALPTNTVAALTIPLAKPSIMFSIT